MKTEPSTIHRILVIDDNPAIHEDFRKILTPDSAPTGELGAAAAALFGRVAPNGKAPRFEIDCATRGQEGLEKVRSAASEGRPYSLAYVDVRMPNGWDGIETINRIWQEHGDLLVVICTAFSDHSWEEIQARLGESDRFLILKKPFDNLEVRQLTFALAERAHAERDVTTLRSIQADLVKAREEADRANRAKSEFLSRMSHELRTPLNAILGFGQLMEMEERAPDDADNVEQILWAGRHLLELINEVLDISAIESGRLTMALEPVAVAAALHEAIAMVRPLAADASVTLKELVCDRYILADRDRLNQVFINLLSNAIKYNREGGAVTLEAEESSPGTLRVTVRDTGFGFQPEAAEKVFVPFERLRAGESGIEGIGLGLAISKRLIELMGGAIGVKSVMGEGTAFFVELPLAATPVARRREQDLPGKRGREVIQTRGTLLYIEDNVSNVRLIERVLSAQRPAIKLLTANDGASGLAAAMEHKPDLVLLDLHLPDLSGDQVLERLSANPRTSLIPVVMVSADATAAQIDRLLAAGADHYLTKPLDIRKCLSVIDEVLAGNTNDTLNPIAA
jgi:signal transduction histidine kinase